MRPSADYSPLVLADQGFVAAAGFNGLWRARATLNAARDGANVSPREIWEALKETGDVPALGAELLAAWPHRS